MRADQLGIEDVLSVLTEIYGLEGQVRRKEFRIHCPEHDDSHPSCDVNLETGYWNCYSCPASGNLISLGCVVLGKSRKAVRKILAPGNPDAIRAGMERRLRAHRSAVTAQVATRHRKSLIIPSLDSYEDGPLTYLKKRGFSRKTLEKWNVRFAPEVSLFREDGTSFTVDNVIAIPILSEKGSVLAWCYRATNTSSRWAQDLRYIYTPQVQDTLNLIWFGMNHNGNASEITVCEGALDAMWCDQIGFPSVAILGSHVKQERKVRLLMRYKMVTIMPDRDTTGVTSSFQIGESLMKRGVPVRVCRYPGWMTNRKGEPAKDAQDLCGLDLELVHARAVPFLVWKHQNRSAA